MKSVSPFSSILSMVPHSSVERILEGLLISKPAGPFCSFTFAVFGLPLRPFADDEQHTLRNRDERLRREG